MSRYLPTTGVTELLPALIGHLLEIKAPENITPKEARTDVFRRCVVILRELQSTYAAADHALHGLGSAIYQAGMFKTISDGLPVSENSNRSIPTPDSTASEICPDSVAGEGFHCHSSISGRGRGLEDDQDNIYTMPDDGPEA